MEKTHAVLFALMIVTFNLSGCINPSQQSEKFNECEGYWEQGIDKDVSYWAEAGQPTSSDDDVLLNIRMIDPCGSSLVFGLNGTSSCEEGRTVGTCIESVNVKLPSGEWEDCTPFADSSCTITLNGTVWNHGESLIVKENGIDLFSDGDVIGDNRSQDWGIFLID